MMGVISEARCGGHVDVIAELARVEGIDYETLRRRVASGRIIIVRNNRRPKIRITGIGEGLRTKVNVNVGTSGAIADMKMEIEKVRTAVRYGTDTIMDLSTGGDLDYIRRKLLEESDGIPFGTVPAYQAWIEGIRKFGGVDIPSDWFVSIVERHLRDGVDFMTIHAGITRDLALRAVRGSRIMPIVSRGGSILAAWMIENNRENPYLEHWDYLIELFGEYDATISLGDALRPGATADAHDELQIAELVNNSKLARDAVAKGV